MATRSPYQTSPRPLPIGHCPQRVVHSSPSLEARVCALCLRASSTFSSQWHSSSPCSTPLPRTMATLRDPSVDFECNSPARIAAPPKATKGDASWITASTPSATAGGPSSTAPFPPSTQIKQDLEASTQFGLQVLGPLKTETVNSSDGEDDSADDDAMSVQSATLAPPPAAAPPPPQTAPMSKKSPLADAPPLPAAEVAASTPAPPASEPPVLSTFTVKFVKMVDETSFDLPVLQKSLSRYAVETHATHLQVSGAQHPIRNSLFKYAQKNKFFIRQILEKSIFEVCLHHRRRSAIVGADRFPHQRSSVVGSSLVAHPIAFPPTHPISKDKPSNQFLTAARNRGKFHQQQNHHDQKRINLEPRCHRSRSPDHRRRNTPGSSRDPMPAQVSPATRKIAQKVRVASADANAPRRRPAPPPHHERFPVRRHPAGEAPRRRDRALGPPPGPPSGTHRRPLRRRRARQHQRRLPARRL